MKLEIFGKSGQVKMDIKREIESWFPNIIGKSFKIFKSNNRFNCVSFTLDIFDCYIWTNESQWPYNKIPRNSGIDGFKNLYKLYDYIECDSDAYEVGYEKVAFYAKGDIPQHAAKQFGNIWRSKLGPGCIIEHKLEWLCGYTEDAYGEISFIMKRKIKS